ncbi:MAG: hypothetical protein FWE71_10225 [Nocardioidaceae bacterium]|nr:hypothetical protein [Nocardioidaceae bacterium]MCL2614234.1 hypothetical protein [Nocardioidaceae bacterium]
MTVFLAWTAAPLPDAPPGPWLELRTVADGLALIESDETLSRVYHELKWSLPPDTPLMVAPLDSRPKLKGLAAGTATWLRDRLPPAPASG